MYNRSIELCVIMSLAVGSAHAQQPLVTQTIDSARVVRLGLGGDSSVTGMLLAPLTAETQVVVIAPLPRGECGQGQVICRMEVPAGQVTSVEIRGSKTVKGAIIGALLGAAGGLAVGNSLARYEQSKCAPGAVCEEGLSDAATVSLVTLIGIGLGATAGGLLGSDTANWRPAP